MANKDRVKHAAYNRAWRAKNPERARASIRKSWAKNGHRYRHTARLKRYGITDTEYCAMLCQQGDACGICRESFKDERHTHVDHCHRTGRVRGVLCDRCNVMLGMARERADVLSAAIEYLAASAATNALGTA